MFTSNNLTDQLIQRRREWVFLLVAGIFLGSLTMLNILGVSRFIDLSSYIGISDTSDIRFVVAVGVLPYPITFLCTDIISEIYGRKRANMVVWTGLFLNLWVLLVLWFGGWLRAVQRIKDQVSPIFLRDQCCTTPAPSASSRDEFSPVQCSAVQFAFSQFGAVHCSSLLLNMCQHNRPTWQFGFDVLCGL